MTLIKEEIKTVILSILSIEKVSIMTSTLDKTRWGMSLEINNLKRVGQI